MALESGWCACLPLTVATMPPIVWAIPVAALVGNAYFGWRRGPMGRPPPKKRGFNWLANQDYLRRVNA